jgi:transposase-like protein
MPITSLDQPKARSGYSREVKATTLAALAVNSGNVNLTARQMGLPRRTVNAWALGRGISPAVIAKKEALQKPLADLLEDLARKVCEELMRPERIKNATFMELLRAMDMATDKWLLLSGDPVTRNWRSGRAPKVR